MIKYQLNLIYKVTFLWYDPDQDQWSVAFLSSESIFRSVIYRIHSGQGFIGSLIWVIWQRIIGSVIRRVPLVKDPKLITVHSGFRSDWVGTSYEECIRSVFVVVSSRNLALFLPVLTEIHQKIDEIPVKYKYSKWLVQNFRFYHEIAILTLLNIRTIVDGAAMMELLCVCLL